MQNKHIEHPEDSILNGDLSALDWFLKDTLKSVKFDGAPAIVWGEDFTQSVYSNEEKTRNKLISTKQFIGTKSVFNKRKIKVNYTHDDINLNHSGEVADILHVCFDNLPKISAIIQCDFIGIKGSNTYTPNTITYKFKDKVEHNIVVAPHTFYKSTYKDCVSLNTTRSTPLNYNLTEAHKSIRDNKDVLFLQPKVSQTPLKDLEQRVNDIKNFASNVDYIVGKQLVSYKKKINEFIRQQLPVNSAEFDNPLLIELWGLVKELKDDILTTLSHDSPIQSYIGNTQIDAEGYVLENEYGMFKVVNRELFSYANFTNSKFN